MALQWKVTQTPRMVMGPAGRNASLASAGLGCLGEVSRVGLVRAPRVRHSPSNTGQVHSDEAGLRPGQGASLHVRV